MTDAPQFIQCPNCKATISSAAVRCFKCGQPNSAAVPARAEAPPPPSISKASPSADRLRVQFTGLGTFVFWLGVVLLSSEVIAGATRTEGLIQKLATGFQNVNVFAFAHNYLEVLGEQNTGSLATFLLIIPEAIGRSISSDPWSVVALVMVCVLGVWFLWDQIKENYFWLIGVPFVGGVAAWVLSYWIIHSILWLMLVIAQGMAAMGLASMPMETRLEAMHLVAEGAGESLKHSDN